MPPDPMSPWVVNLDSGWVLVGLAEVARAKRPFHGK